MLTYKITIKNTLKVTLNAENAFLRTIFSTWRQSRNENKIKDYHLIDIDEWRWIIFGVVVIKSEGRAEELDLCNISKFVNFDTLKKRDLS